jgi:DNA-binding LacI/PurR family transcriptional regulator
MEHAREIEDGHRVTRRPIGIRDVAAAAGVSITTVSHALNGKGRLPEETRERVRDVARRLGYQPSAIARSLAGGRSGVIGLTVSQAEGIPMSLGDYDYFVQLMNAATSAALDEGYSLVLVPAAAATETLDRLQVDGAVVVDPVVDDPAVGRLRQGRIPFVTTGRAPDGSDDDYWVDNDHVAGTRSILDHLAARGARRVAFVNPPAVHSYTIDALGEYHEWCASREAEPLVATVTENLSEGGGYAAGWELLDSDNPPDAIYATLDRIALGVLLAADARGISVPEDLLVAGCTDSHASQQARPPLTALTLNPEQIGRRAVETLIAIVEGRPPEQRHSYIPTRVIARGSTRARRGAALP